MFCKGRYYSNIALYYLYYMGCRIGNKIKSCSYTPQGISKIWLLDYDDFVSLKFRDDGLYNNNLVTNIYHSGNYIELEASEGSKYTTNRQNGLYTHTLDTFIEDFDFSNIADYDLASKSRKYLVVFLTRTNKYLMFGYKPGATFSYTSQTEEATGSLIQLSVTTTYPIFEVDANAITDPMHLATYLPSPVNAYCETLNEGNTGTFQYRYMLKVSAINGGALDINNELCNVSKRPQAALILQDSPIITGYEIEGYYAKGATVGGVPTFVFNPTVCPIKINNSIRISEVQIFIEVGGSKTVNLTSTSPWRVTNPNSSIASLNFLNGFAGVYPIRATGVKDGLYNFDILNTETNERVRLSVVVGSVEWVFKNGAWNANGYWMLGKQWGND